MGTGGGQKRDICMYREEVCLNVGPISANRRIEKKSYFCSKLGLVSLAIRKRQQNCIGGGGGGGGGKGRASPYIFQDPIICVMSYLS